MTIEFKSEQWVQRNQTYWLEFEFDSSNGKPMVQVYMYDNGIAVLNQTLTLVSNVIKLSTPTKFSGYIVIR